MFTATINKRNIKVRVLESFQQCKIEINSKEHTSKLNNFETKERKMYCHKFTRSHIHLALGGYSLLINNQFFINCCFMHL